MVFRHITNGTTNGFHLNNNNRSPPTSAKKYVPKTMNTTTTIRKSVKGGPVIWNGSPTQMSRMDSSESNRKIRRFWWTPKRAQIEVRSDINNFKNTPSKVGSMINIQHRPGGGRISIRDEPVHWQATSRIDSLSNATWSPPLPRVLVRTEKIKWDVQPKIGSLINIDHKPAGGRVAIRDDKVNLSHIGARVDCGFLE